jgi:hypothetical protein
MYDELVKRLREKAGAFDYDGRPDIACDYEQAADAIEELSKQRDRAYDRLCGWCGVCPVDRRNVEDCEIAMIGPEYISSDWATCQPEPPKEE